MSKRTLLAAAIIGWILSPGLTTAADWPQFRGPGGLGTSDAKGLPTTWSDDENIVWKTPLPGAGSSSPILVNGKVWLTAYSGYGQGLEDAGSVDDLKLHLLCIDPKDGKILKDVTIDPAQPESRRVRDHGYAAPTPASDGKALYVFLGKTGVLRFDLDGEKVWQSSVGTRTHGWGCGTSPVLFDDLVIVNASVESRSLVALAKKDGREVWRAGGMNESWNTPHLVRTKSGSVELAVSVKDWIFGFDPRTGKELWRCEGVRDYVCPSIVSHEGIVYAIGGRRSRAFAVRAGGRGDVTSTHRVWAADVGANVSSPVVHDGHLYWVSDRNTRAYCLRLSDGRVMYDESFPSQPYASTLLADGKLYVTTRRGGTVVLPARPEYEVLARNRLGDRSLFHASPVPVGSNLLLRSDRCLYCIGKGS